MYKRYDTLRTSKYSLVGDHRSNKMIFAVLFVLAGSAAALPTEEQKLSEANVIPAYTPGTNFDSINILGSMYNRELIVDELRRMIFQQLYNMGPYSPEILYTNQYQQFWNPYFNSMGSNNYNMGMDNINLGMNNYYMGPQNSNLNMIGVGSYLRPLLRPMLPLMMKPMFDMWNDDFTSLIAKYPYINNVGYGHNFNNLGHYNYFNNLKYPNYFNNYEYFNNLQPGRVSGLGMYDNYMGLSNMIALGRWLQPMLKPLVPVLVKPLYDKLKETFMTHVAMYPSNINNFGFGPSYNNFWNGYNSFGYGNHYNNLGYGNPYNYNNNLGYFNNFYPQTVNGFGMNYNFNYPQTLNDLGMNYYNYMSPYAAKIQLAGLNWLRLLFDRLKHELTSQITMFPTGINNLGYGYNNINNLGYYNYFNNLL